MTTSTPHPGPAIHPADHAPSTSTSTMPAAPTTTPIPVPASNPTTPDPTTEPNPTTEAISAPDPTTEPPPGPAHGSPRGSAGGSPREPARTSTPGRRRRRFPAPLLGWLAALGTLPYLVLKAIWLSGNPLGFTDPSMVDDAGLAVANAVTLGADLLVVPLAFALTSRWGRRVPAWLLLLPAWVGAGLLVPMAVVVAPLTFGALLLGTPLGAGPGGGLAPWVAPLVYGGFAWQGVFLMAAFALHARRRWLTPMSEGPAGPRELWQVLAGGGAVAAVVATGLQTAGVLLDGSPAQIAAGIVQSGIAVAGAVSVLALGRPGPRRTVSVVLAFVGSGVLFSWGLWGSVSLTITSAFGATAPLTALGQLTGLLAGFALAVAGLLALQRR